MQRYMLYLCLRTHENYQFLNDVVDVEPVLDGSLFLEQSANTAQDSTGTGSILNDLLRALPCVAASWEGLTNKKVYLPDQPI